jgi:hypothetical protein
MGASVRERTPILQGAGLHRILSIRSRDQAGRRMLAH